MYDWFKNNLIYIMIVNDKLFEINLIYISKYIIIYNKKIRYYCVQYKKIYLVIRSIR